MKVPNVKFVFDRKKKASKEKKSSVEIEIVYERKQKFIATGVSVLPSQWNAKKECVKLREDAVSLNELLRTLKNKVWDIINEMVRNDRIDISVIPKMLQGRVENMTFLEYVEKRIPCRPVGKGTRRTYQSWLTSMKEYGKIVYFNDVTPAGIRNYDEWLHKKDMVDGTIRNQHKFFKIFINDAIIDGHLDANPYDKKTFNIARGDKDHVDYLTEEQVEKIASMTFDGYMKHVRDLFLLQCYSGLSYSDIYEVSKDCCTETDNGLVYTNRRIKTKQRFTFLILKPAEEILDEYSWKMPKINNAKYNEWLKVIGQLIGEPKLHSHQGRGAFATIALNNGIPLEVVQRILGHSDTRQTKRYASMLDNTIVKQMSEKLT